jgi:hypothetical protein
MEQGSSLLPPLSSKKLGIEFSALAFEENRGALLYGKRTTPCQTSWLCLEVERRVVKIGSLRSIERISPLKRLRFKRLVRKIARVRITAKPPTPVACCNFQPNAMGIPTYTATTKPF